MNIAKLNTASLDDKTFIIKRGTSGEATINNQDKVVDITENGTTEVVADGGYTGLGKVTINTEVSGGGSTPDTPSGEYYLAKPNGWYWKFTDEFHTLSTSDKNQFISTLFLMMGTMYEHIYHSYGGNYKSEIKLCFRDIGMLQYVANNNIEDTEVISDWVACAEGGPTKINRGEVQGEYESIFHMFNSVAGEMTEEDFAATMLSQYRMQRITKEEYEALLTE